VDVRPSTPPVSLDLTAPPEVAPPSLRPVSLPTVIIPRLSTHRRRARVLAPLCAAVLGLGALLYLGQREERAGAALPPAAALVAAGPVGALLVSMKPIPSAPPAAIETTIPLATTTATQPAAAVRSPFRSTMAMDPRAAPRTQGATDRRALYGERK
jgi:hypothetical protein